MINYFVQVIIDMSAKQPLPKPIDELENLTEHVKKISEQVMEILDSKDFIDRLDGSKNE